MNFNVTVQVLCFGVNSVLIAVNVVFTHSFMLSTCINCGLTSLLKC